MPLHSVEVDNFKSYKGVQTIGPFKHFTAVIGPNGAGKSNLMDAISFVLGVRSAQLRSTQLKDLIYKAGELEDSSTPHEQPKKASVTANYIDHRNGQQYRFSRTITVSSDKSGSSIYTINKKVVKLEDYVATLESHNILVKAKNFLVFQGDVEAIASQNPKSLSKLIDQISGSLELAPEYERKKAAYLEASKNSNDTIARRRVINAEIKDFKQQKTEMEKYDQLCHDRDEAIIHHLLWKLFHIEAQINEHLESIESKNETLGPMRLEVADLERSVAAARREYAQVTREVARTENELKSKEKYKEEEKLPRLVECEEKLKHLEKKKLNEEKTMANLSKEKTAKEKELVTLRRQLAIVTEARDNFYAKQQASNRNISISEDKLKEYQTLKAKSANECPKEHELIKTINQDLKTKTFKLSQLEDQLEQAQTRYKKLDQDHDTQTNRKTMTENKIDGVLRELNKKRKQIHDVQAERTRQAQTETELKEKLQDCLKKISEAGAAQRETDSEVRMRTMIEKLRRLFPGVSGRLQDLCSPVARKHDVAIRIVLGRNLNAVVVDSQKTAFECVEYLKIQRLGSVLFIPLDTIKVNPVNERLRNLASGARLAIDLIKHDPVYERAVQHACGNTIICDSTQIARNVVYDKGNEVKAVSLDGTVIHKGGNMSGGVTGLDSSRKFDEREVQGLKRAQEDILAKIKANSSNAPRDNDEALLADISRLEATLAFLKDDLLASETALAGIRSELEVLSQKKDEKAQAEIDAIKAELNSLQEAQIAVNRVEDKIFESFCRSINVENIRDYEGHHLQLQQQNSVEQERLETTVSKLQHQINFETEQLEGLVERQATVQSSSEKTLKTLESVTVKKQQVQNEMKEIDQEISQLRSRHDDFVQTQSEKAAIVSETKKELSKAVKVLDAALRDIGGWNDEIERLASDRLNIFRRCKLESISLPILQGSLLQIPMEEVVRATPVGDEASSENTPRAVTPQDYGIKLDYAKLDEEEKENPSFELEQHFIDRLARLNTQIEAMVPKTRALEKLEEVENRLRDHDREFEAARKLARATKDEFNEIRNKRVNLFNQAYSHIKDEIHEVYRELTRGDPHDGRVASERGVSNDGKAYLELDDFEEPYLHGIKYSTMPPGKRYRDVEQLSGGEKTMAALALLFAIHSYQPSPFFVLDEVDAALDNTNVRRIADYVRKKSGESVQFVVISLKGTFYEKASGLVGIYRDNEWGGTKSLTLDLDQYGD
ncbi:Structural maintenance of chromosomes protein 1 [Puccinia graminis f. sp. tritici]|uniref:Structural maintenance of chromosomes protein n=1 Tax=Puccinia graminis f. sp. tritici TaxID=56615 RepID=A0A5B0M1Y7_PUCGR|nr:Structural maintenance of chromosomes protein 1 [Puccinia graminis f. sp. tritici]KAA1098599.1 Structural maintenance of chromosomes protein 1 [Puccinia graminis f. sp. tritici]